MCSCTARPFPLRWVGLYLLRFRRGAKTEELGALVSHMYVREDFVKAMEQVLATLDIEISMSVSSQLFGALAIIPEKERVRPAILIDVGYTHTDVSLVENAALTDMRTIEIGGKHFASDLAFGLDVPLETAEQVKRRYVCFCRNR